MEENIKLKKLEAYLSNERTLLSYIRTASTVIVLAVAMFKFFESKIIIQLGFAVLIIGLIIFVLGIYRFIQQRRRIRKLELSHV
jgi:putative membrane protein